MTTTPEPPADEPLPAVVAQYVRTAQLWTTSLGDWATAEARRVSSDTYTLADLLTAPVRLARVVTDAGVKSLRLLPDSLAVLADDDTVVPGGKLGTTQGGPVREHTIRVDLAAGVPLLLRPTALTGQVHRVVIPPEAVALDPPGTLTGTPDGSQELTVRIHVGGLPNDTYVGRLLPEGAAEAAGNAAGAGNAGNAGAPAGAVELRIAIDELGDPTP